MIKKPKAQVMDFSKQIHKDEKGFFVYLVVYAKPTTFRGIKAYISDENIGFIDKLKSLHEEES